MASDPLTKLSQVPLSSSPSGSCNTLESTAVADEAEVQEIDGDWRVHLEPPGVCVKALLLLPLNNPDGIQFFRHELCQAASVPFSSGSCKTLESTAMADEAEVSDLWLLVVTDNACS